MTLNNAVATIVNAPAFSEMVNAQGAEADYLGMAAFGAFVRKDHARWKVLINDNRIHAE